MAEPGINQLGLQEEAKWDLILRSSYISTIFDELQSFSSLFTLLKLFRDVVISSSSL